MTQFRENRCPFGLFLCLENVWKVMGVTASRREFLVLECLIEFKPKLVVKLNVLRSAIYRLFETSKNVQVTQPSSADRSASS